MISDNIKSLRKQKGLTQKELAELLHVTSQAVSRWEKGNVEPSVDTISNMAKIFEVTTDEIIGGPENKPKPEVITEIKEKVIIEQAQPVLTICENCKRPIYKSNQIITKQNYNNTTSYICTNCDKKIKEETKEKTIDYAISQRKKSFLWGMFIALLVIFAGIFYARFQPVEGLEITLIVLLPLFTFTFISCLFLKNNFIGFLFLNIASWGVVKFPGLIFSFSLDGFMWLIGMKLLFWILGLLIGLAAILLALIICLPLSVIAYPFAIKKNFNNPELTEII